MFSYENVSTVAFVILVLLSLACACGLKKWEYDECVHVGHGKTYCTAQAAGCFDSRRSRK